MHYLEALWQYWYALFVVSVHYLEDVVVPVCTICGGVHYLEYLWQYALFVVVCTIWNTCGGTCMHYLWWCTLFGRLVAVCTICGGSGGYRGGANPAYAPPN